MRVKSGSGPRPRRQRGGDTPSSRSERTLGHVRDVGSERQPPRLVCSAAASLLSRMASGSDVEDECERVVDGLLLGGGEATGELVEAFQVDCAELLD